MAFSAKDECHKLPPELNKSVSGPQCGVGQGAEFARSWGEKATSLAKDHRRWNPATGPISATICSVLEASWKPSIPGFWASDRSQLYSGWSSVQQGVDNRKFLQGYGNANVQKAAGHPPSTGMEKARSQLFKEGNFMAARALDFLVCGAIHEPHLPADGSIPNQFFCVRCDQRALATRKHELC